MNYVGVVSTINSLFERGKNALSIDIPYDSSVSVTFDNKTKLSWNSAVLEEPEYGQAITIQLGVQQVGSTEISQVLTIPANQPTIPFLFDELVFIGEFKNTGHFYKEPHKMVLTLHIFLSTAFLITSRYFIEKNKPGHILVNGGTTEIRTILHGIPDDSYYNHISRLRQLPKKYNTEGDSQWKIFFYDLINRPNALLYGHEWKSSLIAPKTAAKIK